jgi:hypothetical protein
MIHYNNKNHFSFIYKKINIIYASFFISFPSSIALRQISVCHHYSHYLKKVRISMECQHQAVFSASLLALCFASFKFPPQVFSWSSSTSSPFRIPMWCLFYLCFSPCLIYTHHIFIFFTSMLHYMTKLYVREARYCDLLPSRDERLFPLSTMTPPASYPIHTGAFFSLQR